MNQRHAIFLLLFIAIAVPGCANELSSTGAPSRSGPTASVATVQTRVQTITDGEGAAHRLAGGPAVTAYLRHIDGSGVRQVFDAERCTMRSETPPGLVRIEFDCAIPNPDGEDLSATARLDLAVPEAGTVDAWVSIESLPIEYMVEEVGVQVTFADSGSSGHLLVPAFTGYIVDDPPRNLPSRINLGHGESVQATAYYDDDGSGVLAFAVDPRGTEPKIFEFRGDGDGIGTDGTEVAVLWTAANPDRRGERVAVPFPVRFVPFFGDWYDAAQIYRGWAEAQGPSGFLRRGPLEARTDVPRWLVETDVFFFDNGGWYDGSDESSTTLRGYADLASALDAPRSLLTLWDWNDHDDPNGVLGAYRPRPRLPVDLAHLEDQGVRSLGYTRFLSFSKTHDLFDSLDDYFCQGMDGRVTGADDWVDADLSAPFWQDFYEEWAIGARYETGLSAVFHDAVGYNLPDFDRPVDEPHGETASFWEGMGEIAEAIGRVAPDGLASFHESAFERLIPTMDIEGASNYWHRIIPGDANSHAVPFFATLYADYTLTWPADDGFGPFNLPNAYQFDPIIMTRALAKGFSYGNMLNTSEIDPRVPLRLWDEAYLRNTFGVDGATARGFLAKVDHYYDFLRRAIETRRGATEYLVFGRLLRDPWRGGDRTSVRMVITYPDSSVVPETFDEPAVYATAWRSPEGRGAIVVANPGTSTATAQLSVTEIAAGADYAALVDRRDGRSVAITGDLASVTLEAGEIRVLELTE